MMEGVLADDKEYSTHPLLQLLKGEIFGTFPCNFFP